MLKLLCLCETLRVFRCCQGSSRQWARPSRRVWKERGGPENLFADGARYCVTLHFPVVSDAAKSFSPSGRSSTAFGPPWGKHVMEPPKNVTLFFLCLPWWISTGADITFLFRSMFRVNSRKALASVRTESLEGLQLLLGRWSALFTLPITVYTLCVYMWCGVLVHVQASPASRNVCGPDDVEQDIWEHVQTLTPQQRRSRACAIVAREREEVGGRQVATSCAEY